MRTFVAVDVLSAEIVNLQNEILHISGWTLRDIKPVEPQNFHFTLIFLGETSDHDLERIKETLADVRFEPFTLTYQGVGGFPSSAAARVVWVGVDQQGAQKLIALAHEVILKMSQIGFSADKPFSPHMTFLRAKGRSVMLKEIAAKYEDRTFGFDQVDRVHLKKSSLTPSGPVYSNIYTIYAQK